MGKQVLGQPQPMGPMVGSAVPSPGEVLCGREMQSCVWSIAQVRLIRLSFTPWLYLLQVIAVRWQG